MILFESLPFTPSRALNFEPVLKPHSPWVFVQYHAQDGRPVLRGEYLDILPLTSSWVRQYFSFILLSREYCMSELIPISR